ncbi:uncharacterized protein LOC128875380 [Hylaeus volcanicus]|uniref:uncharacterized protein LOC128875380 n=1 Tax=Hylaeus volcanicus TaxID=313075 RepID=UPI0023B848C2|nr:uncharacterized protein LOC128875380 [Hylaeus volcanicus]
MDVFKTRQKYKPQIQTCLCFSVMGQRRFRISMGALIASPEAGDASVNIVPQMKKRSAITDGCSKSFVSTMSDKDVINESTLMPTSHYDYANDMNKTEKMLLMENSVFDETSISSIHDNCQFPYYRSNKNSGRFPDAVLVKDVGVSCMLLNQNIPEISTPEASGYLVKQLKKEYNDLSNITSKITAYTKDILNHLSKRNHRKNQLFKNLVSSKHAIASQYIDNKGNLCLKLRLISNAETQCRPKEIVKESDSILLQDKDVIRSSCNKRCNYHNYYLTNFKKRIHFLYTYLAKTRITYRDQTTTYDRNFKMKHEKEVQTIYSREDVETNTSKAPSRSTSSIYNYFSMRTRKSPNETLKSTLMNFADTDKYRNDYKSNADKDGKEHLKSCSPVMLTNWKEISRSKLTKNKPLSIIPDKSREMTHTREKYLQNRFFDSNTSNNVPDTEFHTVNVRIVKHNRKHV